MTSCKLPSRMKTEPHGKRIRSRIDLRVFNYARNPVAPTWPDSELIVRFNKKDETRRRHSTQHDWSTDADRVNDEYLSKGRTRVFVNKVCNLFRTLSITSLPFRAQCIPPIPLYSSRTRKHAMPLSHSVFSGGSSTSSSSVCVFERESPLVDRRVPVTSTT